MLRFIIFILLCAGISQPLMANSGFTVQFGSVGGKIKVNNNPTENYSLSMLTFGYRGQIDEQFFKVNLNIYEDIVANNVIISELASINAMYQYQLYEDKSVNFNALIGIETYTKNVQPLANIDLKDGLIAGFDSNIWINDKTSIEISLLGSNIGTSFAVGMKFSFN